MFSVSDVVRVVSSLIDVPVTVSVKSSVAAAPRMIETWAAYEALAVPRVGGVEKSLDDAPHS
jgi:hypothetical protein